MPLHKFLLDVAISDTKDCSNQEKRFIYHDKDDRLMAWIVSRDQSDSTILKAFKEVTAGTMTLQDLLKIELPIKINGLESNGGLLANTGQGLLRYSCKNGKITGLAETLNSRGAQKQNADQIRQPIRFPGMQETDYFSCGDLIISRHETIAQGVYGEPFFQESLLLVSYNSFSNKAKEIQPWISIGNSQVDNDMNLIHSCDHQLFDIPIINFVIESRQPSNTPLLIGWNRIAMQALSIEWYPNNPEPLKVKSNEVIKLDSSILEDASTSWINCQGRSAVWRDRLNHETFYTWRREK